jgi:hypothetical protein
MTIIGSYPRVGGLYKLESGHKDITSYFRLTDIDVIKNSILPKELGIIATDREIFMVLEVRELDDTTMFVQPPKWKILTTSGVLGWLSPSWSGAKFKFVEVTEP